MSKELDDFYKKYSARIIEMDDTPLVKVMHGGTFKVLSIEEYEEMTNKIADLEAKLAEKDQAIERLKQDYDEVWEDTYSSVKEDFELNNNCNECRRYYAEEFNKQLAEKEELKLRIKKLDKLYSEALETVDSLFTNQDKISFAVEKLEKLKELIYDLDIGDNYKGMYSDIKVKRVDVYEVIDNQIKQLKENRSVR